MTDQILARIITHEQTIQQFKLFNWALAEQYIELYEEYKDEPDFIPFFTYFIGHGYRYNWKYQDLFHAFQGWRHFLVWGRNNYIWNNNE